RCVDRERAELRAGAGGDIERLRELRRAGGARPRECNRDAGDGGGVAAWDHSAFLVRSSGGYRSRPGCARPAAVAPLASRRLYFPPLIACPRRPPVARQEASSFWPFAKMRVSR